MRDFAIAAGLAAAAFGPAAAAPLGLYGILVLVWGTAMAGVLRQRTAAVGAAGSPAPVPAADPDLTRNPPPTWTEPGIRRSG
jgi:hypothetical protein